MSIAIEDLRVRIFADGADLAGIRALAQRRYIAGFTTNPTLMRQAGVTDYERFAREALAIVKGRPISFEVFADEATEMTAQARYIATWGPGVYVKIPVTNTRGVPTDDVIHRLSSEGVAVNVTAIMTLDQVERVAAALAPECPAVVSVFAGRIADAGIDPVPIMQAALEHLRSRPKAELLWASPRELLNIVQASEIGCPIITVTHALLDKLSLLGKDLAAFSLETVQMFYRDAEAAAFKLSLPVVG